MSRYVIKKEHRIKNGRCYFVFHVRKKGMLKNLATFRKYEDAAIKKDEFERLVDGCVKNVGSDRNENKRRLYDI